MKTEKKQEINNVLIKELGISIIVVIFMTAVISGLTYVLNRPGAEVIRNSITFLWGCFVIIFLWYQGKINNNLEYDNNTHYFRFLFVFAICFCISVGMIFAPAFSWVFLSVMVVLAMFSNAIVGLVSGSILLLTTVSLTNDASMNVFFLYFMIGLIGVSLFHHIDLEFKVAGPMFLSGTASFVLQTAYIVIFENQPFSFQVMFMPILNLFLNMVLLFLFLKFFSNISMYLLQDKYFEINDQEFPVMQELKKMDKAKYFEAIHTAYLGERMALELHMNDKAVKGCCYYYKIANDILTSEDGREVPLLEYYEFPEDLKLLISECQKNIYGSKESCVVLTANKIIRTIQYSQKELKNSVIPYNDIIEAIFEKLLHSKILENCDISIRELNVMKNICIKENLYYDFLR